MMKNRITWCVCLIGATALFAACDLEEGEDEGCSSNSDCEVGEVCEISDGSGDDATGMCVVEALDECTTDAECTDGYTCDTDTNMCRTSCEEEAQCTDGYFCSEDSVCTEQQYVYVAIVSETPAGDDTDNTTPGPDVDAIRLVSGGDTFEAEIVEAYLQGAGGDSDEGNNFDEVSSILGPIDAIGEDGTCELGNEDPLFWSMGDTAGFAIVSFPTLRPIADGDIIEIWELDELVCSNVSVTRADAYTVYIGVNTVSASEITSAAAFGDSQWITLGASDANGGLTNFTVDLPE